MNVIELVHDRDHPVMPSNIDLFFKARGDRTSRINVFERVLPPLQEFDLLLLHGGEAHLWDLQRPAWYDREVAFIRAAMEAGKPVVGYCLGAQLIAEALGGRVYPSEKGEVGFYQVNCRAETAFSFNGICDPFITLLWHTDHFTLPEDCCSAAFTPDAENQIVYSERVPAVGFQFHPEYSLELLRHWASTFPEIIWHDPDGPYGGEDFLRRLEEKSSTLPLYSRLMENAFTLFRDKFGIIL